MTKTKNSNSNNNKKNSKRTFYAKRKTEITFDPESRKDYLQGFSQRKQQRRAFGLAMQKVKDRKAKLEKRAERKEALQEQMEQAEQQKAQVLESLLDSQPNAWLKTSFPPSPKPLEPETVDNVKLYQDTETKSCWGGEVIVTTSTKMFGEEDSVDETTHNNNNNNNNKKKKRGKDAAQEYAGNVERFMHELKGNMPGKKKKTSSMVKVKGKHGAAKMKGMGGDLKTAQRILKQAQTKKGRRRSK